MKHKLLFSTFVPKTQINESKLNKKAKIFINYFFGPLFFLLFAGSLYRQISNQPEFFNKWGQISSEWNNWKFCIAIILVFVNWLIESLKWQLLVKQVHFFSFGKAVKSVLSGCAVTLLTPNRVGEFGGRILYVKSAHRLKAISLSLVGSFSQLMITMLMGCVGLFVLNYFLPFHNSTLNFLPVVLRDIMFFLSVLLALIFVLFYFRLSWIVGIIERLPFLHNVVKHIRILNEFSSQFLFKILFLSFVRYIVFILQYVLLLQVMHVELAGWFCFCLLTVFYMAMSIIPSLGIVELPIRLTAAWVIFKMYSSNELGIGAASLCIWIINVVVPAVIGSLLMLNLKIIKEK
jgi:hypothetical protein